MPSEDAPVDPDGVTADVTGAVEVILEDGMFIVGITLDS